MLVSIVSILVASLIAIISSFYAFKNKDNRPTKAGYSFIALTVVALCLAVNGKIQDEKDKKALKDKADASEAREQTLIAKSDSLIREVDGLKKRNTALQRSADELQFQVLDLREPNNKLVIQTTFNFDVNEPKIKSLKEKIWSYARSNQEKGGFKFTHKNQRLFITDGYAFYSDGFIDELNCDNYPDMCIFDEGPTDNLYYLLGMAESYNATVQFFYPKSNYNTGFDGLKEGDSLASFYNYIPPDVAERCKKGLGRCSNELASSITLLSKSHGGAFTFRVIQPYSRQHVFDLFGMKSIERSFVRVSPYNMFADYGKYISSISIELLEGKRVLNTFKISPVSVVEIEGAIPTSAYSQNFLISSPPG